MANSSKWERVLASVFLSFLLASAASTADLEIEHGAYLSAADLDSELSGVVVSSQLQQKHSSLLRLERGEVMVSEPMGGIAVNQLRVLAQGKESLTLHVAGAVGGDPELDGSYIHRTYTWGQRGLRLDWDSEQLGLEFQGDEVQIAVGTEGRLWAALRVESDQRVSLAVGSTNGYEALARVSLEHSSKHPGRGPSSHFPSLVVLDEEAASWSVALLWRGQTRVLGAGLPTVKAVVPPSTRGNEAGLAWQPIGRQLWLHRGNELLVYPVPKTGSNATPSQGGKRATDSEGAATILEPLTVFDMDDSGGIPAGWSTRKDGSVVLLSHGSGRFVAQRLKVTAGRLSQGQAKQLPWSAEGGLLAGEVFIGLSEDRRVPGDTRRSASLYRVP